MCRYVYPICVIDWYQSNKMSAENTKFTPTYTVDPSPLVSGSIVFCPTSGSVIVGWNIIFLNICVRVQIFGGIVDTS